MTPSAQRSGPRCGVAQLSVVLCDAHEQGPGCGEVTRTLIQVRKCVRPAEMMGLNPLGPPPALGQHGDGLVNPPLIGKVPCCDDPALGDEGCIGRDLPELIPQGGNFGVMSERPVAIGQNRMLVDRPRQQPELLKFPDGGTPAPLAVADKAQQLVYLCDVGNFFDDTGEQAGGVVITLVDEVVRRLGNPGCKPFRTTRTDHRDHAWHEISLTGDFGGATGTFLGRFATCCSGGPALCGAGGRCPCAPDCLSGVVHHDAFINQLLAFVVHKRWQVPLSPRVGRSLSWRRDGVVGRS